MGIGAGKAAEVGALADADAGDEEGHIGLLRLDLSACTERYECNRCHGNETASVHFMFLP